MKMQRRTEAVLGTYLLMTAGLVLLFSSYLEEWAFYFGAHCAGAAVIFSLRLLPKNLPPPPQLLRDWFPVLLMPLLFKEVEIFAAAFGNWGLTESIRQSGESTGQLVSLLNLQFNRTVGW